MNHLILGDSLDSLIDHRGKTPKKLGSEFTEVGVPVASAILVSDGHVRLQEARHVSAATYKRWMPEPLQRGDVLLTSEAPLGRVALVPSDEPLVLGQRLFGLRGKHGVLDSRFLFYALQTEAVQSDLIGRSTGTTVFGIRQSALRAIRIPAPGYADQRVIAEVLGALDDKIAANTKLARTIDELLSARYELVGIDVDPSNQPATLTVAELVELNPRLPAPAAPEPVYVDMQKLPTTGSSIASWDRRESRGGARFQNGDTLLARITPCLENRKTGFVDFLASDEVALGSTEYIVMRSRPGVPRELSYFLAVSQGFREHAIRHMIGSSGRQRVSAADLASLRLTTPDPLQLDEFGRTSGPAFEALRAYRDENRTLAATRDALLPALMSGRLRVKDAEAVAESAL